MKREAALERRRASRNRLGELRAVLESAADAQVLQPLIEALRDLIGNDPGYFEPYWHLAFIYEAAGNYGEAGSLYRAAISVDPQCGGYSSVAFSLYGQLIRLHELQGDARNAAGVCNRFLEQYPLSPEVGPINDRLVLLAPCAADWLAHYQEACRHQEAQQHTDAVRTFDEALRLYPEATAAYLRKARSLHATGDHDETIRALEAANAIDITATAYLEMGITYGDGGNPYVEETFYARALELSPSDARAMYSMGTAFYARGEKGQALELLEKAVDLAPEAAWVEQAEAFIADLLRNGVSAYPDCLREPVAWAYWTSEELGLRVPYPEQTVLLPPSEPGELMAFVDDAARRQLHFRVLHRPAPEDFDRDRYVHVHHQGHKRTPGIVVEASEALEVSAQPAHFWELHEATTDYTILQGLVFRGEEILEFWCRCPAIVYARGKEVLRHPIRRAQVLSAQDVHRLRKQRFQNILKTRPGDVEALAGLGSALLSLEELPDAMQVYARILQIDPQNARAHGDLGLAYWRQGKLDLSIKSLQTACEGFFDPRLFKTLGMAYANRGYPEK
ncbi:MAG: tetratricopeptide repeat protein, partial [Armatimonadetes bacterium]|nr:tetratricopeptide repeat protein [Armatimonadota bacterium]